MVIRASEHSNEWVRLTAVRPVPTDAPTGYTVSADDLAGKSVVGELGQTIVPASSYSMTAAPTGERANLTTITSVVTKSTRTYTNRLVSSDRHLMPMEWETTIEDSVGPTTVTKSWLVYGAEAGTGAALQVNERFYERFGDEEYSHHNPNQGGVGQREDIDPLRCYGGIPLYYSATGTVHEAAWRFVDFGGDPASSADPSGNYEASDKGQDETHPILWYAHTGHQKVELNVDGTIAHEITYWTHHHTAWTDEGDSGPLLTQRVLTNLLVANYFDEAYVLDIALGYPGGILALSGWAPPAPNVDWYKFASASKRRISLIDGSSIALDSSGYSAAILRNSANDLTIAFCAKLQDVDDSPGTETSGEVDAPAVLSISYVRTANTGGDLDENSGCAINLISKARSKRRAGWIGGRYWIVVGTGPDVFDALNTLWTSGKMDAAIDAFPPAAAREGTIWPPSTATPTSLETVDVVAVIGNSQLCTASNAALFHDGNPELGKFPYTNPLSSSNPIRSTDSRQQVWVDGLNRWEILEHGRNGSAWGTSASTTFGLETSLSRGLIEREGVSAVYVIKGGYGGSPLQATATAQGVWAASPSSTSVTASATCNGTAKTFTAAAGTFTGVAVNTPVQIGGSVAYALIGGPRIHGLDGQFGNNTPPVYPMYASAVNGDGSVLTVAAYSTSHTFTLHDETATFTFRFGPADLRSEFAATVSRALADLRAQRKTPRLRLTVSQFGEGDLGLSAAAFQALLEEQATWLRGLFGVTVNDTVAPHCIVEMSANVPSGTDEQVAAIRTAQANAAATITNAFTVPTSDLTHKLESGAYPVTERAENGTHLTASANVEIGWRINRRLDEFTFFPARTGADQPNPIGESYWNVGDTESAMAFIVEDGTGLESANSYTTLAFAASYLADLGGDATWTAASDATQEAALRFASAWIDQTYTSRFVGYRSVATQALEVPRALAYDPNGYAIEGVPVLLERATVEIARRWVADATQFADDVAPGADGLSTKSASLGPLQVSKTYQGAASTSKGFPVVDRMLQQAGLLRAGGWARR